MVEVCGRCWFRVVVAMYEIVSPIGGRLLFDDPRERFDVTTVASSSSMTLKELFGVGS
jgi:hypothetical protein